MDLTESEEYLSEVDLKVMLLPASNFFVCLCILLFYAVYRNLLYFLCRSRIILVEMEPYMRRIFGSELGVQHSKIFKGIVSRKSWRVEAMGCKSRL
jgi:hypothetical protein